MAKKFLLYTAPLCMLIIFSFPALHKVNFVNHSSNKKNTFKIAPLVWKAPDISSIEDDEDGRTIKYGRKLIENTSAYIGPRGMVAKISNGLNCQNCHLEAGTRLYANNYAMVATTYPKYRERSGRVETLAYRINECLQRSLNGIALDSNSREMQAMIAYINWVGSEVTANTPLRGIQTPTIPFLNRAADTLSGRKIYQQQCKQCHGADGGGKIKDDSA